MEDLAQEKHSTVYMGENVASMTEKDRAEFSRFYWVRPVKACASDIAQVRRCRYYWMSWPITSTEGVKVTCEGAYYKARFDAIIPDPKGWADPGWEYAGEHDTRIPTFMRALPKGKPTHLPTGIANATPGALRRWKAHAWRYPP